MLTKGVFWKDEIWKNFEILFYAFARCEFIKASAMDSTEPGLEDTVNIALRVGTNRFIPAFPINNI